MPATFRNYGQLLILNAVAVRGIMCCSAGMERISVDLGQFVVAGEPVAVDGRRNWPACLTFWRFNPTVTNMWNSAKDGIPVIQARGGPHWKAKRFRGMNAQTSLIPWAGAGVAAALVATQPRIC